VAIDERATAEDDSVRTFAPADQLPRPSLPEVGAPGVRIFGGFLNTDEYVPELTGSRALDVYERMRRSDGMVAATLRGIKLPLLSASWEVVAATEDPLDLEIADAIRQNLFERISWQEHLREVLTFLDFGFSVFEKVWEIGDLTDGSSTKPFVFLKKLAPRMQRTVWRWITDDAGSLTDIEQLKWVNSQFSYATIPVDKLLIFTNEKEGGNYVGRSVLRPAYKHWFIKDQLYRIQAIAAERHGVGIPVMTMAEGKDDGPNMTRAENILVAVRAHEQGYVVEPNGFKFRIEGMGSGRAMDVDPMIKHHDWMISVSALAQFLTLGVQEQGARALSTDLTSLFLMTEKALGDYIGDIHNRYLIPQLVKYNYGGVTKYPKLAVSQIESRKIESLISVLAQAAAVNLVTPDLEVENALRAWAGITPLDKKILTAPEPTAPGGGAADPSKSGVPAPTTGQGEGEA
jgi:hypothetical protein